ncbi:hypothetical protein LCGC14_1820670 [marine sediment metagenome]|uniref:Uncharacterized protein n=1 Tax=marine sediment metagenome TaxID=412755 RepID=A0A0F9GJ82_9ZZZZ
MEIYRLTRLGSQLAHSYNNERTPMWGVIHYLNRKGVATKEQILEHVPYATSTTIAKLRWKRVISEDTGVTV